MMLTFDDISIVNYARMRDWHGAVEWTLGDWGNALAGECGELCNVIKKIRRDQTGLTHEQRTPEHRYQQLKEEIADVYIYLDLIATMCNVHLPSAVQEKFNKDSEKRGFPQRL